MKHLAIFALGAALVFGGVSTALADTTGTFVGASDHITTGGVTIVKNDDGTATITFDAAFSLDGAPDPRVGFGKDGAYAGDSDLGKLKKLAGGQSYLVPANLNIDDYNELYIWCLKFGVPLGVAKLG